MNKTEIISMMKKNHADFTAMIHSLNENDFCKHWEDKWTPGQQAEHIIKSVSPVVLAFYLPKIFLRILFGKANRESKTYEALVEKYHRKLAEGYKAGAAYTPKETAFSRKENIIHLIDKKVELLNKKINACSEEELDTYILPHPLLGKLTLREMLYFTAYHVQHHHISVEKILQS